MKKSKLVSFCLLVLSGAAVANQLQMDDAQTRELASLLEQADERALIRDSLDLKAHINAANFDESPLQALNEVSDDALERFLKSLTFSDTGLASYYSDDLDQLEEGRRLSILRLFGSDHVVTRASSNNYLNELERELKAAMGGTSRPLYTQYPDRTCYLVALQSGCAPQEGDWCSQLHCGGPIPGPGDDQEIQ
jgi:hypothetical protein